MIDDDIFKALKPENHCLTFAYTVSALTRLGTLAAENDTGGLFNDEQRKADLSTLLELMRAMMGVVIDGIEGLERQRRMEARP